MARYHNVDFANDNSSGGSGGDYYSSSYGSSYGSNYGSNYSSGLGPQVLQLKTGDHKMLLGFNQQ